MTSLASLEDHTMPLCSTHKSEAFLGWMGIIKWKAKKKKIIKYQTGI